MTKLTLGALRRWIDETHDEEGDHVLDLPVVYVLDGVDYPLKLVRMGHDDEGNEIVEVKDR